MRRSEAAPSAGRPAVWKSAASVLIGLGAVVFGGLAVAGSIQRGSWPVTIPMLVLGVAGAVWIDRRVRASADAESGTPAVPRWVLVIGLVGALVMAGVLIYLYV